ncbi:hypothetical protein ACOME3_006158 [Neoechinorhynchus agilis]
MSDSKRECRILGGGAMEDKTAREFDFEYKYRDSSRSTFNLQISRAIETIDVVETSRVFNLGKWLVETTPSAANNFYRAMSDSERIVGCILDAMKDITSFGIPGGLRFHT